jgi:NAD(P)-dependent dehydrogenase (short-subunit alcohol dehydrogenase family)
MTEDKSVEPEVYDSLDGQVALVTGATRGIGAAIAAALAERGAVVYAGARDTGDVTADPQVGRSGRRSTGSPRRRVDWTCW